MKRKIFIIFLSTSAVFDGSVPQRMPYEPVSPITEYGRQNVAVEQRIEQCGDSAAILRGTKFLGPNFTLFHQWARSLKQGEVIHPFDNVSMSPIPLSCIVSVLQLLCQVRQPGIWQISGSRDLSYLEAAQIGADLLKADPMLIQPVNAPFSRHNAESLNMDRIRSCLGVESPDVVWTVEKAFLDPPVLLGALENKHQ